MSESHAPLTLEERHQAFLQALAQKDRDGAMYQVEAIITEAPFMTGKYCALAASILQQQGQIDLAARLYEDAVAFDPDDTAARLYLGIALRPLGREPEARQHWAEIAQRRPNSPEAQLQSVLTQVLDGDLQEAQVAIEALLASLPADSIWRYDVTSVLGLIEGEKCSGRQPNT